MPPVQKEENVRCKKARSLVAIHKRVIADNTEGISGGSIENRCIISIMRQMLRSEKRR